MRKKIYDIIATDNLNKINDAYDVLMIISIILSIVPLAFKQTNTFFEYVDYVTVTIFIVDYVLRLITADYKLKKSAMSFLLYPFTPMAIIDLIAILPSLTILHSGLKLFKIFRLLRALKVLRTLKFLRYSKSFEIIINVFKEQKRVLSAVATLSLGYILISALIIYNVEPESFKSFFDAVYWATISLTTVGYGDLYPVSTIGKTVAMISSVFGIAIIALPSGVITAAYLSEINKNNK